VLQGKVRSPKAGTYKWVQGIDAPDDYTVIFHLKQPWAALLWNVAGGQGMGNCSLRQWRRNQPKSGWVRAVQVCQRGAGSRCGD
jgi:hypothetical protein